MSRITTLRNHAFESTLEVDPVAAFDLLSAPGHLLRRNHQRSYELFTARVGDAVTRQQFALMLALAQRPGSSQNDLVGATGMDKSTLKELIGRLVARGWVERGRDTADSRAWTMVVTLAGRALLDDLLPRVAAAQRDILEPLAEADRVTFMRCLRVMIGMKTSDL